ncbi:hypothetical protein [Candidatus Viadribacter manganicus]|uniref:Uncharacterized protein n=1 Tax=Candidatus Viadribacter manganicus TaxID=1759059 RepID=A0A1B1AFN2_9PROT|nr:hypothetical protein [Candidatus Viadribacter manganicus]ANP45351.1 hypothetical protein ATE48_05195 [Candidatus Viadribacter manganicus]
MRAPPIPQRIPPLAWRKPAFVWTPIALALSIGWPVAAFYDDITPQRLVIIALFVVFALALISLGLSYAFGRAPKSRRIVVLHVVFAGVVAMIAAPLVLSWLVPVLGGGEHEGGEPFSIAMSAATTPLVVIVGLPVVLVSGIVFAWTALKRGTPPQPEDYRHDVQPFR